LRYFHPDRHFFADFPLNTGNKIAFSFQAFILKTRIKQKRYPLKSPSAQLIETKMIYFWFYFLPHFQLVSSSFFSDIALSHN